MEEAEFCALVYLAYTALVRRQWVAVRRTWARMWPRAWTRALLVTSSSWASLSLLNGLAGRKIDTSHYTKYALVLAAIGNAWVADLLDTTASVSICLISCVIESLATIVVPTFLQTFFVTVRFGTEQSECIILHALVYLAYTALVRRQWVAVRRACGRGRVWTRVWSRAWTRSLGAGVDVILALGAGEDV